MATSIRLHVANDALSAWRRVASGWIDSEGFADGEVQPARYKDLTVGRDDRTSELAGVHPLLIRIR